MSLLKGVFIAKKKNGDIYYRSSLTYKSKHISLGSYETELLANKAYTEGNMIISDYSVTIDNYTGYVSTLPFEKCVSLINFRDNGMYFKTPIYLHPKYFDYYLSQDMILKFDVDDLFYYSTHTIMKRDGHLFVSDYGMQVNILGRYGIKNYAVPGKDYLFKNGDIYDFRYRNIEIINRYYGVTKEVISGRIRYIAKIHINGDYIIGKYDNEKHAAIAYNKAVDILKIQGIKKNYSQNYIENMNSIEYAAIYSAVKISNKLINYKG